MLRILLSFFLMFTISIVSLSAKDLRTAIFKVEQLECKNCEQKVQKNIRFEKGIKSFKTDINTRIQSILRILQSAILQPDFRNLHQ